MKCKNKEIKVKGIRYKSNTKKLDIMELFVIVTNDKDGKTISIDDGETQFSIEFEQIERYLK